MRSSSLIFIAGLIFIILTDTILGYQIRHFLRKKWRISIYVLHSLFFVISLILFQLFVSRLKGPGGYFWIEKLIGVLFLFYAPKLIFILLNGIGRLFKRLSPAFTRVMTICSSSLAGILFLILLYSITWGRYNYKIDTVPVATTALPASFEGFRIVQLADLHLGSFGESYRGLSRLVKEVNALHPDMIVFTGDMVNNFADEMPHWINTFKELKAPYGKFAVTGNHDYGDYTRWPTPEAKQDNMSRFYSNMEKMGFQMLNNTRVPIVSQGDTLWLAGVENWGKPPFPRYGNLSKAIDSLDSEQFIILLSHDPSHWRAEVLQHNNIFLTLSGHTHAMQFGIKIGRKEWSPSKYIYPEYDGLYRDGNQYLYVSRGQGYLGFPGRIGLRPIITVIELRR